MEKIKILLGSPVKCYHKKNNGEYSYMGLAYYVGNGYCVDSFTDTFDNLKKGINPDLLKYDRYMPLDLLNRNYGKMKTILYPYKHNTIDDNFFNDAILKREDFNIENIEDFYSGHLDEFWWWNEIQNQIKKEMSDNN